MILMGIDPGLSITGIGIIEYINRRMTYIDATAIRSANEIRFEERLKYIYDEVVNLMNQYHPDICIVEEIFYSKNVKTAITMGHTRGVILLAGMQNGLQVKSYTPREIKLSVVGNGGATKNQVQYMVQKILQLKQPPTPLDASDALALAICHAQRMN